MSSVWEYVGAAREFVSRHRRHLLIGAASGAGVVLAYAYVRFKPMYDQIRAELKMMEKLAADMHTGEAAQQQLLHRFNHNLSVCDQTLRNFAAQAKTDIAARFDVVAIRAQIKRASLPPSTAAASAPSSSSSLSPSDEQSARERAHDLSKWNEFKLAGFSRTLTALYSVTLLHALIKVQLSIVSRYVLTEQQSTTSSTPQRGALGPVPTLGAAMTEEVNRAYFGLSEWSQREGLKEVADAVEEAVRGEMTRWELNANCSKEDIQMMLVHIRHRLDDEVVAAKARPAGDDDAKYSSLPPSASPFLPFIYPPPAVIESKLNSMELQLREAAQTAISSSSTSPSSPTSSPPPALPTSSPSALTNLAGSRLHEMAAETLSVLHSETFATAVQSSLSSAFDLLLSSLLSSLPTNGTAMPFASVMVKMMKLFDALLPEAGGGLYDVLRANVQVREMCEVIYFPMDEHGRSVSHTAQAPHAHPPELVPAEEEMRQLQALLASAGMPMPMAMPIPSMTERGRGEVRIEEVAASSPHEPSSSPLSAVSGEEGQFRRG